MLAGLAAATLLHATLLVPGAAPDAPPGAERTSGRELPAADTTDAGRVPPDWQQEVGYTVEAELDTDAQVLRAAQSVRYRNASPDTLDRLYFHLHLNAFRPNSVWARNEEREEYPFGELEDPDFGFERLREVRLVSGAGAGRPSGPAPAEAGTVLEPRYPGAPDSTVVRLDLPEALAPGEELTLRMRWDARPATLCRRQCRDGRDWDLAQWYPRVAVYDGGGWQDHPLYPQGEFYGDFATYDVTLDLADDQVVGATGVPVEGEPGWEPSEGSPRDEPLYQRDAYDAADGAPPERPAPDPGLLDGDAADGRKRVRFHARDVHHFAWSVSPDYVYEGDVFERGALPEVAVHVLHRPGDDGWDDGVAAGRTIRALSWLETLFRPFPYPQITNLHRLESGGTEFPMVIMDGSASMGLIVHETTHQYVHGILANNEWRQAWLDEGVTSFVDTWFAEEHGSPDAWDGFMENVGRLDGLLADPETRRSPPPALGDMALEGDTLPTPLPIDTRSELFANYGQYGYRSYTRPQAVLYMLREMLGKETTRRVLRTYYDRYEFRHVSGAALRRVAEEVSGRDLGWFFDQWLHGTGTLDYAVGEVSVEEAGDGEWRVSVEVLREGENWMPVTVEAGDASVRVEARERSTTVELLTDDRPATVELDPDRELLDTDRSNDRKPLESG